MSFSRFRNFLASGAALGALMAAPSWAAPAVYTAPNITTVAGSTSVILNGQTFVNQGLQGVARLPATTTRDFNGDTFGAFSGLDVLPGSWRKTATGYTGVLYSLPDRGPNGVGSITFSDYPGRVSIFNMDFTPYTGTANLPVSANSQHQLQLTQTGGFFFRDFNNNLTTGLDPGAPGATSFVVQNGMQLPGSTVGPAAGKISLDAEGLRFLNNGNFYVSDEYGAMVYYFDRGGRMLGAIQPPPALVPRDANGNLSYTSLTDASVGRRLNQGLEGLAVTPDQKKLVTLLQSAAMQDSTSSQQTRTNTRLMIYDISQSATPSAPIGHYVLQLPTFNANGNGAPNRTAAQSEILALNDTQFLVLSRDGNGLGQANLNPVYKSVLLVDITGATNLAGTAYETGYTPIAANGVLNTAITPVNQVEVVNLLNSTQLGKFGINLNNVTPNNLTLTEKWEGMALLPVLEDGAPQDYFLIVGNDNDFLSTTCSVGGLDCAQSVNSDAVVLTYRLTLPTYVDPQFLQSMRAGGPATMAMTSLAVRDMAVSTDISRRLQTLRHADDIRPAQLGGDLSFWASANGMSRGKTSRTTGAHGGGFTLGLDGGLGEMARIGAAAGYYWGTSSALGGFHADHNAAQLSVYGALSGDGFYTNLTGTYSLSRFTGIDRPGAYGQTGRGKTDADGFALTGEAGYMMDSGTLRFGPLAGFRWLTTSIDGYTETGASGGNILFPNMDQNGAGAYFGGEASLDLGVMRPVFRLVYNSSDGFGRHNALLTLVNAKNVMGAQTVTIPGLGQESVEPSLTLTGDGWHGMKWWASYGAKVGVRDGAEHRLSLGLNLKM